MVTDRAPNVKSFPVEQRKPFRPKKPKKWSHQDELEANIGKEFKFANKEGGLMKGKLIAADAFTLKIQFDDETLIVFKHAIGAYGLI